VKQQLKLSDRVYERRIKEMREESLKEVLNRQSIETRAQLLKQCIVKVQALELQANDLMRTTKDDHVKLAAMDRVRQYAIDIAKLLTEGPFLFNIIQRDGLHRGVQRTAAELKDQLDPATEDPNRVA
jgi:hypothetical protein